MAKFETTLRLLAEHHPCQDRLKVLLTEKEMGDLLLDVGERTYTSSDGSEVNTIDCLGMVESQNAKTLRSVGKWLDSPCPHTYPTEPGRHRAYCMDCIDELHDALRRGTMPGDVK